MRSCSWICSSASPSASASHSRTSCSSCTSSRLDQHRNSPSVTRRRCSTTRTLCGSAASPSPHDRLFVSRVSNGKFGSGAQLHLQRLANDADLSRGCQCVPSVAAANIEAEALELGVVEQQAAVEEEGGLHHGCVDLGVVVLCNCERRHARRSSKPLNSSHSVSTTMAWAWCAASYALVETRRNLSTARVSAACTAQHRQTQLRVAVLQQVLAHLRLLRALYGHVPHRQHLP